MRQKQQIQLKLSAPWPDHPLSKELAVMAAIIDGHPCIAELAWQDIVAGKSHYTGAPGMAAMAVVKAAVLHKVLGVSYERLAFNLLPTLPRHGPLRCGSQPQRLAEQHLPPEGVHLGGHQPSAYKLSQQGRH